MESLVEIRATSVPQECSIPAPQGATVNSQGRKPLEVGGVSQWSPVRGGRALLSPLTGLDRLACSLSRGLRPWLLTIVPSGLFVMSAEQNRTRIIPTTRIRF